MIKFGTSGFRGVMGDNFTKENVQKIAYGIYKTLKQENLLEEPIVVGYDNRFMGKEYSQWMAEVLIAYKMKVLYYTESVPCTLIAHLTKNRNLSIYISASHNPYKYNGVKLFVKGGREPDKLFTDRLEKISNKVNHKKIKTMHFEEGIRQGNISLIDDIKDYCDFVVSYIGKKNVKNSNVKILFNAMHGSTVKCMKYIFDKIGLKNYDIMNENIDPYFEYGMPAPYKKNLTKQVELVKKGKYDFGFALDGDGDRVTFIDKTGEIYDCNFITVVFYYYLVKYRKYKGGLVRNRAFTNLADKVVQGFGYNVYDAVVGFKNVANEILKTDAFMGAETNGIAFKDHILHKDGLFCGMLLIDVMCKMGKTLKEIIEFLKAEYSYPCETIEYAYETTEERRREIYKKIFDEKELPATSRAILSVNYDDGMKIVFDKGYWAFVRFSGTECVVRLFAELESVEESEKMIKELEKFIGLSKRQ